MTTQDKFKAELKTLILKLHSDKVKLSKAVAERANANQLSSEFAADLFEDAVIAELAYNYCGFTVDYIESMDFVTDGSDEMLTFCELKIKQLDREVNNLLISHNKRKSVTQAAGRAAARRQLNELVDSRKRDAQVAQ